MINKGLWKKDKDDQFLVSPDFTEETIRQIEEKLKYQIPKSYIALMASRNGGRLKRSFYPIKDDHGNIVKLLQCACLWGIGYTEKNEHNCLLSQYNNKMVDGIVETPYHYSINGFLIGDWGPSSGWGFTFFYLDYTECGAAGEPSVEAYVMEWSYAKHKAIPVHYHIANNFEEFIDGLSTRPATEPFDFISFEKRLLEGARQSLLLTVEGTQPQKIGAFGLYIDEEGTMIASSADTKAHMPTHSHGAVYLTAEWDCEGIYDGEILSQLTALLGNYSALLASENEIKKFCNALITSCTTVLNRLKTQGYFRNVLGEDIILMVGTTTSTMPQAKLRKIKALLNS